VTDTVDEARLRMFIAENPKFLGILRRALEEGEKHINDPNYLGWEWSDVKAYPAELMKLVREGIAEISYKSRRYTNYRLSNREAVKKVLESIKR